MDIEARPVQLCHHLVSEPDQDAHLWFTGEGQDRHWVCVDCVKAWPELPDTLVECTDAAYAACIEDSCFDGAVGMPAVQRRATALRFETERHSISTSGWLDDAPRDEGGWWVLTQDALHVWTGAELEPLLRLVDLGFEADAETGITIDPSGTYVAIFQTSGQHGQVYRLADGAPGARLDRQDYRPENSCFPVTFVRLDDRVLLVAATDWNRLDLLHPMTGDCLTARAADDPESERSLDYFHARLTASPDGRRLVDTGWIWHPWGSVRTWRVDAWLDNPRESEDGPSVRTLAERAYFWDGPACWIDNTTAVLWGFGDDDEWLIPAALLYDTDSGELTRWFPGPRIRQPSAWPPKKRWPSLFYDQWLFAVEDATGITVWDVATGEQVCADEALAPMHYHPVARQFISLKGDAVELHRLVDGGS
jgi:hypothetical protein